MKLRKIIRQIGLTMAICGASTYGQAALPASISTLTVESPFGNFDIEQWSPPAKETVVSRAADVNRVIDETSSAGGGRVTISAGTWDIGAIKLKSNVELHLAKGAVLRFSDDPADYLPAVRTTWEGVELMNYAPLIYAYGCTNVAITGQGMIAPKMGTWSKWRKHTPEHKAFTRQLYEWCSKLTPVAERKALDIPGSNARPHLIQFNRCKNVRLDGFSIRESPFWTIHLYMSEDLIVRDLDVRAHGFNNDGVDVESSRRVLIEKCRFDQGDDVIVIKSGRNQDAWRLNTPSENIVARDLDVVDGHVLLGIGSELSGGVRNVYLHHARLTGNTINACYVKTNERRGGFVENIAMSDCEVNACAFPNRVSAVVCVETDVFYQWRKFKTYETRLTPIRNIRVWNVHCAEADHLLYLKGDHREPIRGVHLKNVTLDCARKEPQVIINADDISVE